MNARLHLIIKGRVQGVFFRMFARSTAKKYGVTGWVRNNSDGTVELVAEGPKQALEAVISHCERGTYFSKVEDLKPKWEKPTGEFNDFEIRY